MKHREQDNPFSAAFSAEADSNSAASHSLVFVYLAYVCDYNVF